MSIYIDLHIKHGDVVLDAGHNPTYLTDRDVIAQDIVHAILDTGLANLLVSDRGTGVTQDTQTQIKLLVEDDVRITIDDAEERFEVKRQDLLNQYVAQKDLLIRENTATRDILETKIQNLEADMEKQLQRALDNPLANR